MRTSSPLLFGLASMALVSGAAPMLAAATATSSMTVNATVSANCSITTTAVTFPAAYDPIGANATGPADGTGTIAVTCTKGAGTSIALDLGSNASGTQPRMKGPGSDYLAYVLYSDSGRTTAWSGVTRGIPVATSKASQNFPVYARIPGGQDVSVGSYTDTVTATLNY
jgi:spore coat protein U-like protein